MRRSSEGATLLSRVRRSTVGCGVAQSGCGVAQFQGAA